MIGVYTWKLCNCFTCDRVHNYQCSHLPFSFKVEINFERCFLTHGSISVNFALMLQCTCWFLFIFYQSHNVDLQLLGWNSLSQSLCKCCTYHQYGYVLIFFFFVKFYQCHWYGLEFCGEFSIGEVFVNVNMNLLCKNCKYHWVLPFDF